MTASIGFMAVGSERRIETWFIGDSAVYTERSLLGAVLGVMLSAMTTFELHKNDAL